MATVKKRVYTFDGKGLEVKFNCSKDGVFSTNIHCTVSNSINLEHGLTSLSLSELERKVTNAFYAYETAHIKYSLKIAINLSCNGFYSRYEDGRPIDAAGKLKQCSLSFSNFNSYIAFDYEVLIEQDTNGNICYFNARKSSEFPVDFLKEKVLCGGFVKLNQSWLRISDVLIIEYTETTQNNLDAIKKQLLNASVFLHELILNPDLNSLLQANNINVLKP